MMKHFRHLSLFLLILAVAAVGAFAQETQVRVIDEVVAQVNDGVITLSRVKRESKSIVETYIQEGKTREEAQKLVDEKQGELIANLINEELLIQKAKESGLESDIDASINQRLAEIMKQYGLKTVESLYQEMEKSGVDPQELKDTWRKQATRDLVIQRQVQSVLYWKPPATKLKEYFEKNKSRFTKPETVSISELFLGFAGRDEAAVRTKAKELVAELRAGGDFDKLAKENGDKPLVTQEKGKAEGLIVRDLVDTIGKPLGSVKVGGYTEPIEIEQLGITILRVDGRVAPSDESVFDENAIRLAMMNESFPDEQKKFLSKLREESYIKISDTYRPIVAPILFADERKEKPAK
ncbi:MAG: peptidyl-prolyl cis-trans isomerase [Pyrinomonadaceae bacterium]